MPDTHKLNETHLRISPIPPEIAFFVPVQFYFKSFDRKGRHSRAGKRAANSTKWYWISWYLRHFAQMHRQAANQPTNQPHNSLYKNVIRKQYTLFICAVSCARMLVCCDSFSRSSVKRVLLPSASSPLLTRLHYLLLLCLKAFNAKSLLPPLPPVEKWIWEKKNLLVIQLWQEYRFI